MKRKPEWKQDTPREQLVQLLSGVRGTMSTLHYVPPEEVAGRLDQVSGWHQDMSDILRYCRNLESWEN